MLSQTDLNLEEMCHCFKLSLTPHWLSLELLMNYHWSWCDPDWGIYYIGVRQDGCSAALCKLSYSRKHFPLTIEMDLLVQLNYHEHLLDLPRHWYFIVLHYLGNLIREEEKKKKVCILQLLFWTLLSLSLSLFFPFFAWVM